MNIKEVKDLIQEVLRSDINEFELEHTGTKIRLKRGHGVPEVATTNAAPSQSGTAGTHSHLTALQPKPTALTDRSEEAATEEGLHHITSPIVGTFYHAPSPGAEPYVKVGDMAEEGTILCVVEAMKLMNEIPSDIAGEIVRIYVENGHPVEYGQDLFGIRPRK